MTGHPRRFLTAEWRHLAMINFACDPALLAPLVPTGTELGQWNGQTLVSLVGFRFLNTRVMGLPIPFHRNFDEVNLRFYVRRKGPEGWRRGVVFVKEIVPRAAIAAVARAVYNENYVALPMDHRLDLHEGEAKTGGVVEYGWRFAGERHHLRCTVAGEAIETPPNSETEFITEHYWGYARQRDGRTAEYRVEHPRWRVHAVSAASVSGDFSGFYGSDFGKVLSRPPVSAFVAEGSAVTVRCGVKF